MANKKSAGINDVLNVIGDLTALMNKRFDKLEARSDKLEMQVFNQGEDIKTLKSDMADVKTKVDHIYNVLDAHMKRIEDILQENKVRDMQQERMERWIFQLADSMNVKLKYE